MMTKAVMKYEEKNDARKRRANAALKKAAQQAANNQWHQEGAAPRALNLALI